MTTFTVCDVCDDRNATTDWMKLSIPTMPMDNGDINYDICSWECLHNLTSSILTVDEEEEAPVPVPTPPQPLQIPSELTTAYGMDVTVDGKPVRLRRMNS